MPLSLTAFMEVPDSLRESSSRGECIVHENGVVGLDDVRLAEMIVSDRVKKRALKRAIHALRWDWVVIPKKMRTA